MNVVELWRYSNRDTVDLLGVLLGMSERGEITGLVLSYRRKDGTDVVENTGHYGRNLSDAVSATMRASWVLTQLEDETRGLP